MGCDASDSEAPPPGDGPREAEEEPEHRCRACRVGTLIMQAEWPRPSVAEIMELPLQAPRQGRLPFT